MEKTNIRLPRRIRRYLKNRDGATAIEFALLIMPFSLLVFGIIELAILFFFNSTLNHATAEVSRQIRTGQFQATCSNGAAEFKTAVCGYMAGLGNCEGRLRIEVVEGDGTFASLIVPPAEEDPEIDEDTGEPVVPDSAYATTGPRAVVIVRSQYYHKLAMPGSMTRLANQPGNVHLIQTASAFRNEPFPTTGCGA